MVCILNSHRKRIKDLAISKVPVNLSFWAIAQDVRKMEDMEGAGHLFAPFPSISGHENLNLKSENREFMDPPSVQHDDHVVTITPPAAEASSIPSSSAAVWFQTSNSTSVEPPEGIPTEASTSAATTEGQSQAPRRPRSQLWKPPRFWTIIGFCITSVQIILLVAFLSLFRDEHPDMALRVWVVGYGVGCLAKLPLIYWRYKQSREQSNLLPQAISLSLGSEIGESQSGPRQRFGKILKWSNRILFCFFVLWFGVGVGIVDTRGASKEAPRLNSLCTFFLVFTYFRYILPLTIYIVMQWAGVPIPRGVSLPERPREASANVILALPTYKFNAPISNRKINQANKEDARDVIEGDERVGAPDEVVECCICLDPYRDGVELKELPCTHHFHVKCIDQWLKINASCPICKREVGISIRAFDIEPAWETITV